MVSIRMLVDSQNYLYLRLAETQWKMFWNSFDAAENSNTGLSCKQRFNYLHAAHVIAGFALTGHNCTHTPSRKGLANPISW